MNPIALRLAITLGATLLVGGAAFAQGEVARVFIVSSPTFQADMGGLADADAICQSAADNAGLMGTYRAWLCTDASGPDDRFVQLTNRYMNMQGELVANGWADLTDGTLQNAVIYDENGDFFGGGQWSNCDIDGTPLGPADCTDYSSTSGSTIIGAGNATDSTWTNQLALGCAAFRSLKCFGQTTVPFSDLSITLVDSADPVNAGADLTYTVTVTNTGSEDSTGGSVTAPLPAGVTYSSSSDCTEAGGTVTCDIGALVMAESESVSYTVTVDPTQMAPLSNTAMITANEVDMSAANDSATEATAVIASTDLSIVKADSVDPVDAGEDVTYTLTVTNLGPSISTGATVTDVLPSGLAYASSSDCTESGGTVTCAIGALAPSMSESVSFTATVDSAQTTALSNTATVVGNETDSNAANDSATEATAVDVFTDLSIAKADSVDPVDAGADLTYTLTVTNLGPSTSTGATLTDVLPSGLTFDSSSDCNESGGTVTCAIGTLAPSMSESVSFTATVDEAQTTALSNTATVVGNETDSNATNDSATEATEVSTVADLSITKDDGVTTAAPGTSVTYTIVVANAGPSDVPAASVEDLFPPALTCTWSCTAAAGASCAASGVGDITESVDLPEGSSVTYLADCEIDAGATGSVSNTATVSSSVSDPNSANNSATDADELMALADLQVTSTLVPEPADLGEIVTIDVTVLNAGPSNAENVTLTSMLPEGLVLDSTLGCAEDPAAVPTCSLGTLGAGETVVVTLLAVAASPGTSEGGLEISSDTEDPDANNDLAALQISVGTSVDIPVLGPFGPLGLALLLASAGWIALRRRV